MKQDRIVNLMQNAEGSWSLSKVVPTLPTRTSLIWSMRHKRCLHPHEHLLVMGLPVFDSGRNFEELSGIEQLVRSGRLTGADIVHAAGNSMVQISVGAFLIFALGSSTMR